MNSGKKKLTPNENLGTKDDVMLRNKKLNRKSFFWFLISLITLSVNFLPNNLIDPFSYGQEQKSSSIISKRNLTEIDKEFNSKLAPRFRDVDAVIYYVKKHVSDTGDKLEQFEVLVKLMRQRFVHAYAVYGVQENWMAVMAGRLIWRDLSAKVIPDDILKGEAAACSQVSLVLMEACRRLNIPSRKVGLQGHYAMEVLINNQWYYCDANLKPDFSAINGRKSLEEIIKKGEHFKLYANTILDSANIAYKFSKIEYGDTNDNHAPRAHFFQATTKELSHWGWMIPLAISYIFWRKKRFTNTGKQPFGPEFLQQFRAIVP